MKFLGLSLVAWLSLPLSAPSPVPPAPAAGCVRCVACAAADATEATDARVVPVHVYNQSRLSPSTFNALIDVTNRIWAPYAVRIEPQVTDDAIAVVISPRANTGRPDLPPVLGDTLFNQGHATRYMHLWLATAEDIAVHGWVKGVPFSALTIKDRDAVLVRMLGVALAHELGHYLLDTTVHSGGGLLRKGLTLHDLAQPDNARLRLTREQQAVICAADGPGARPRVPSTQEDGGSR